MRSSPSAARGEAVDDFLSEIKVERDRARRQYRAYHRGTGEPLSTWQGSPDQALTAGEAKLRELRQPRKVRACLRCGAQFESTGPGHRLCSERCRQVDGPEGPATPDVALSELPLISHWK